MISPNSQSKTQQAIHTPAKRETPNATGMQLDKTPETLQNNQLLALILKLLQSMIGQIQPTEKDSPSSQGNKLSQLTHKLNPQSMLSPAQQQDVNTPQEAPSLATRETQSTPQLSPAKHPIDTPTLGPAKTPDNTPTLSPAKTPMR